MYESAQPTQPVCWVGWYLWEESEEPCQSPDTVR